LCVCFSLSLSSTTTTTTTLLLCRLVRLNIYSVFYYRPGLSKRRRDKRFILTSAKCIHQLVISPSTSSSSLDAPQSPSSNRINAEDLVLFSCSPAPCTKVFLLSQ
jgi:hypothetical protein